MAYHSELKQRIRNNELLGVEYIENYFGDTSRMLLYFQSEPKIRPILADKIEEYRLILKGINTRFEQFTKNISPIDF